MNSVRELSRCRICQGEFFTDSLKLKDSPLANELYPTLGSAQAADTFPLEIVMCKSCKHIQLKHIVDPERLFSKYIYASGTSETFRMHFDLLAEKIANLVPAGVIVEVGSNDGTLLEALKNRGLITIGVEPSASLVELSKSKCNTIYHGFLNQELTKRILSDSESVDLVVGNNVFAHIDDIVDAIKNVYDLLKVDGYFIFEVAHVLSLVKNNLFDTIYHEHMSYHSVIALIPLLQGLGFSIVDVEEIETHGGSIRVICRKTSNLAPSSPNMDSIIAREREMNLDSADWIRLFDTRLKNLFTATQLEIASKESNASWLGYGAPAKAVTFINQFDLGSLRLLGIIDDNPEKQGKYLPSSGFEIISKGEMLKRIDEHPVGIKYYCIIFPWNLSDEIAEKLVLSVGRTLKAIWFLPYYKER
ncbi:unannotated protein [freshwater metagenome]|uniref:Unannotated protein n=1 Tax=freshwater metagenome TaxID=449393 RepID=A0A6J7A987_9ZZZZ